MLRLKEGHLLRFGADNKLMGVRKDVTIHKQHLNTCYDARSLSCYQLKCSDSAKSEPRLSVSKWYVEEGDMPSIIFEGFHRLVRVIGML